MTAAAYRDRLLAAGFEVGEAETLAQAFAAGVRARKLGEPQRGTGSGLACDLQGVAWALGWREGDEE